MIIFKMDNSKENQVHSAGRVDSNFISHKKHPLSRSQGHKVNLHHHVETIVPLHALQTVSESVLWVRGSPVFGHVQETLEVQVNIPDLDCPTYTDWE